MARRRSHSRRSPRSRRRRSSYPRRGGGHITYRRNPPGLAGLLGGGRKLFGVVDTSQLTTAGMAVGGFIGTAWLLSQLDKQNKITGGKRIAAKAGIAILAGVGLNMLKAPKAVSAAVTLGGLIAAGLDIYNKYKPGGTSGLGWFGFDEGAPTSMPSVIAGELAGGLGEGMVVMDPSGQQYVIESQ